MPIDQELLTFAATRKSWQRDSLRRICTQSDLTATDLQEILENLKATEGLCGGGMQQHLDAGHLASRTATAHATTILTSISDVQNANRLAPKQTLLFAEAGITLIYGYNGSGKTGYGRILKQICRSRQEKQDPILGNVYTQVANAPATAKIGYKTGGASQNATWKDGSSAPAELGRISVFDTTTAPLYADQQNKIEFLPLGLDVLPRLAKVCEHLATLIATEMTTINGKLAVPLPSVSSQKFTQFLARFGVSIPISQVPSEQDIDALFVWDAASESALFALEAEIRKISEPATQSAQYTRLKRSMDNVKTKLNSNLLLFSAEAMDKAYKVLTDATAAREAATIAAAGRFLTDPLGEAPTSSAWRKLYESAEAFNASAYPGEEFPATGIGRVCLLCQQPYDGAASERLQRFKAFLQDTTQKDALLAEKNLKTAIQELTAITILSDQEVEQQLTELADIRPTSMAVIEKLKVLSLALNTCKESILQCLKGEVERAAVLAPDPSVIADADIVLTEVDAEIGALDAKTKDDSALKALKEQHAELLDQKNCASNVAIFLSRRGDLCSLASWKSCKTQCDTTAISRKGTELRETYLTNDFRNKIAAEIKFLGLDYLPVKVEGRTDKGVGYIGVALSKTGREPTSRILSEGEFRGLALACFFAEIGSIHGHDGVVVDDPVSSLDHLHVTQVAKRLIQEAQARPQVIVFTHDLGFYYDLWVAASAAQVPVHRNWIYRDGTDGFGTVVSNDGPWQVKKVRERLPYLESMITALPDQASSTPSEYQQKTEEFYSKLRETWERLVEECLLNDVVGRFQPGVATQSLKGVSVTDDDYVKVFFAMKKASEFSGHDRPAGRQPVVRTKDEMKNDLGELWKYEKELKKRADDLGKQRRVLETPPAAVTTPPIP
jgi:energy-coupling factor transporter ATP-binding protein EcfA2